jgi:rhomboid protease GluP
VGILHLAMNMYVLWSSGRLVERILGNAGFLVAYVASGLAGSVASIVWSPLVTSAGASGAIFGVYGAMLGFVLRERTSIPREAVQSLLKMGVFFVGINVMIGLRVPGIDMAAHLGGLAGGFVAGLALAHPLTPDGAAGRVKRAVILAVGTLFAVAASTRLMTRSVAGAPLLSSVSSGSRAAV